jgi:predicted nucleic acid-binding protein
VILRFLTIDPPELAARSARLMAKAERDEVSLYVSPLVLAEVIWAIWEPQALSMALPGPHPSRRAFWGRFFVPSPSGRGLG